MKDGRLVFGIDYDSTWTAAPDLFRGFVRALQRSGHHAVIVTARGSWGEMGDEVRRETGGLPVVFTNMAFKRGAAKAKGWDVDIWIDDFPEFIGNQASLILPFHCEGLLCERCGGPADRWMPVCGHCCPDTTRQMAPSIQSP